MGLEGIDHGDPWDLSEIPFVLGYDRRDAVLQHAGRDERIPVRDTRALYEVYRGHDRVIFLGEYEPAAGTEDVGNNRASVGYRDGILNLSCHDNEELRQVLDGNNATALIPNLIQQCARDLAFCRFRQVLGIDQHVGVDQSSFCGHATLHDPDRGALPLQTQSPAWPSGG